MALGVKSEDRVTSAYIAIMIKPIKKLQHNFTLAGLESKRFRIQYKAQIREVEIAKKDPKASSNLRAVICPFVDIIQTPKKLISKLISSIDGIFLSQPILNKERTIAQVKFMPALPEPANAKYASNSIK